MYAIKKSKTPYAGIRDRDRRLEEVRILRELGRHEHVVEFIDNWEEDQYLYIQTEYCENGSLDKFLDLHGSKGRLDEFRVWKVMIELCLVCCFNGQLLVTFYADKHYRVSNISILVVSCTLI